MPYRIALCWQDDFSAGGMHAALADGGYKRINKVHLQQLKGAPDFFTYFTEGFPASPIFSAKWHAAK